MTVHYRISWHCAKTGELLSDGAVSFFEAYSFCRDYLDSCPVEAPVSVFRIETVCNETGKTTESCVLSLDRTPEDEDLW